MDASRPCSGLPIMVPKLGVTTIASDSGVHVAQMPRPWVVTRDQWSSIPITVSPRWRPWSCRHALHIIVWLRSVDGKVVLAAPAVPQSSTASERGELHARFKVVDVGAYNVSVVAIQTSLDAAGGRALYHEALNAASVTLAASPTALWVVASSAKDPASSGATVPRSPPRLKLHLRTNKTCRIAFGVERDQDWREQFHGRWIRCNALTSRWCERIACLRDGWAFVPWGCMHRLHAPAEARAIATHTHARRRRQGQARPLWMVFMGSSIIRGTFHSLVDLLGAEAAAPIFADAFNSTQGVGSATKCWGWSDVQVGSGLRLSFQDFRMSHYVTDASNTTRMLPALARLAQLLREGPDLIVVETFEQLRYSEPTIFGRQLDGLHHVLQGESAVNWRGRLVLTAAKESAATFGMEGGYCQYPVSGEDFLDSSDRAFRGLLRRLSPSMRSRVAHWNEDEMAGPMFVDTEVPLKSGVVTVHWHRYNMWRGQGESKGGRTPRGVAGIVAEMSAQMYLAALLDGEEEPAAASPPPSSATPSIEVCNECPLRACCPWQAPVERPAHTLTRAAGKIEWEPLERLSLAGCARSRGRS